MKTKTSSKILALLLSIAMLISCMTITATAATENGYNFATATDRDYDGTAIVEVTDVVFSTVFDIDDVSADATGTISSADAGAYTTVDLSDVVPKGDDIVWYSFLSSYSNMPTNVTISKVDPTIEIEATPSVTVYDGQEIEITVTITNNFDNNDGLPTVDEMLITVENASVKDGSTIVKEDNTYTVTYVTDADKVGEDVTISVNVVADATNYNQLEEAVTETILIVDAPADYSKVDSAIELANALSTELYTNFEIVTDAIEAVVEGKNITEQAEVDAMADAILDAIALLEEIIEDTDADAETEAEEETEATQEVVTEGTADVNPVLELDDDTLSTIFTEEELASGEDLQVVLTADEVDIDDLDDDEYTALEEALAELADNAIIGFVLDLTLDKWIGDSSTNITELDDVITITIDIPEEYQAEGRVFSILRYHDGEVEVLEDLDDDDTTITFETDRFSTYAVAYVDEVAEDEDVDGVKTGDTATALPIAMGVIAMAGMVVLFKKRSLAKQLNR